VEVVAGTENNLINTTASVDIMRGKQLTALTKKLTSPSQVSHSRLISNDSSKNYDPLLTLPIETPPGSSSSSIHKNNEVACLQVINPYHDPLEPLGRSISVPDIIFQYKKLCEKNGKEDFININKKHSFFDLMASKDSHENQITGKKRKSLLDLRKKLSLKDVSNGAKKYKESRIMVADEIEAMDNEADDKNPRYVLLYMYTHPKFNLKYID